MASKLTTAPAVYQVYKCNFYPGVLVRMNPGAMQPATDTCAIYGGEHRFALGICRGTDGIDYVNWAAGGYSPLRHPTAIGEDLFTLIPSKIMGTTWWFKVNGSWQVQQELQKQVRTTTYTRVSRVDIWRLCASGHPSLLAISLHVPWAPHHRPPPRRSTHTPRRSTHRRFFSSPRTIGPHRATPHRPKLREYHRKVGTSSLQTFLA